MDTTHSPYCRATVNYTGEAELVPTEVDILDGRMAKDSLDRQQCGFELVSHVSRVEDWHDRAARELVCYDEIASLARSLTGCDAMVTSCPGLIVTPNSTVPPAASVNRPKSNSTHWTTGLGVRSVACNRTSLV